MRGRFFWGWSDTHPPHLVWWWGSPHFHNEAPSTGVAERRAGLVRWAPHMGEWSVPPLGRGGKCTPFFQPGGQNPPPHPTLTSLPGLIAHLLLSSHYKWCPLPVFAAASSQNTTTTVFTSSRLHVTPVTLHVALSRFWLCSEPGQIYNEIPNALKRR